MPLYMDRHDIRGITAEQVAQAPEQRHFGIRLDAAALPWPRSIDKNKHNPLPTPQTTGKEQ